MRRLLVTMMVLGITATAVAQDPPLDKLVEQAKHGKTPELRTTAIARIAEAKPAIAVPALIGLLATPDEAIQLHTTLALGEIGTPAVAPLEKRLRDDDETVRFYAAWGLAMIGPAARSATAELIRALRDEDEDVRYKAAFALGRVSDSDAAVAALVAALGDDESDVADAAMEALGKLGQRAVAPLREQLKLKRNTYRAAVSLSKLAQAVDDATAKAAIGAVPDVLNAIDFSKPASVDLLVPSLPTVLVNFGPKALPALRGALEDENPRKRERIAEIVGWIGAMATDGDSARRAVDMLLGRLNDADANVRATACNCIDIFLDFRERENALTRLLGDDCYAVSCRAYRALRADQDESELGDKSLEKRIEGAKGDARLRLACLRPNDYGALLRANLAHKDLTLRLRCACALTQAADVMENDEDVRRIPDILRILRSGLESADPSHRRDAINATVAVASAWHTDITPLLATALKSDDPMVRQRTLDTIADLEDRSMPALLPVLLPLLREPSFRQQVAGELGRCGVRAVPHLVGLLDDRDPAIRTAACNGLAQLKGDAKEAVPALVAVAKGTANRAEAAAALHAIVPAQATSLLLEALEADPKIGSALRRAGNAGKEPAKRIVALVHMLQDDDAHARRYAAEALLQLDLAISDNRYVRAFGKTELATLTAMPKFARARFDTGDVGVRRDTVAQLAALRAVVQAIQSRDGMMDHADNADLFEAMPALYQGLSDLLQHAMRDRDHDVRRAARRALYVPVSMFKFGPVSS